MSAKKTANLILKLHGSALIVLGCGNSVASFMATRSQMAGPFQFLHQNPFVEVGLLQAYLLMSLLGVCLLLGSLTDQFFRFDIVGLVAHLVPLLALFSFRHAVMEVMGQGTILASLLIHTSFISLELVALFLFFRGGASNAFR